MKTLLLTAVTIVALGLNTCHAVTHILSGTLDPLQAGTNGANEPGGGFGTFDSTVTGAGNGTGTVSGNYDEGTKLLNYTVTWQDLTSAVTNMHFHFGAPGTSGGVNFGIPGPWASPQIGAGTLTDPNHEPRLLAGDWYVNVHTESFGGGEIRGQVTATRVPEPTTAGLAAAAFLSVVSLARRKR